MKTTNNNPIRIKQMNFVNQTKFTYILGIDAGVNGYLTLINALNNQVLLKIAMPNYEVEVKPARYKKTKEKYVRGKKKGEYKMRCVHGSVKEGIINVNLLHSQLIDVFSVFHKEHVKVVIENQAGGGFVGSQTSKDTMMKNYGRLLGLFELMNIDYTEVSPRVWKRDLGVQVPVDEVKELSNTQRTKIRKQKSIDRYIEVFGSAPDTHDQAESALIAFWFVEKQKAL